MRKATRTVPEANNFQIFIREVRPINNAVGTKNYFAQFEPLKFRHHASAFRKSAKRQRGIKQLIAQSLGGGWMVGRDVADDALQIIQRVVGEEYLEIHWGMR